jgi:type II restriction enzyme
MNLQCRSEIASAYKSGSQVARVVTEDWCTRELYCAACQSDCLSPSKANTPSVDFVCPACEQLYQLKSLKHWNERKIVDAGYDAMMRAIRADRTPNLLLLQYSANWFVNNLVLIPRMVFTESAIERRAPLNPQARRAGWVGCNILLTQIPSDGKIPIVRSGMPAPQQQVRQEFSRVKRLAEVPPDIRGWTLDVLNVIRRVGKGRFSLGELYTHEPHLRALHPHNQNVRPKIRQQLQVLRDVGIIQFSSPGQYSVRD